MAVRKNVAKLSKAERERFVAAVKHMKEVLPATVASGMTLPAAVMNQYDKYVYWHSDAMRAAHRGSAFFPWHRLFILLFEQDMQTADQVLGNDGDLGLPYWDWTRDRSKNPKLSRGRMWRDDLMGPDGDAADDDNVTKGPFKDWTRFAEAAPAPIQRRVGRDTDARSLPTKTEEAKALKDETYDVSGFDADAAAGFRNLGEGWIPDHPASMMHNRVHNWVGGTMAEVPVAPNDPAFFLHHANVDRLWARWHFKYYAKAGFKPYEPSTGAAPGHNLDDMMEPWSVPGFAHTPKDVLNHQHLGYSYDDDPRIRLPLFA
jgi:tyrosinase